MGKPEFHPDVDYSHISEAEQSKKAYRDLYTIFYLTKNCGLTDMEIHEWAHKLKFNGYNSYAPDSAIRGNIYRWNDLVVGAVTGDKQCEEANCTKICSWGFEDNQPTRCARHVVKGMRKVVEERMIKKKKEGNSSKGKFYLDESFAKRVFPNGTAKSDVMESTKASQPLQSQKPNFMNPQDMFLKPEKRKIMRNNNNNMHFDSNLQQKETFVHDEDVDDPEFIASENPLFAEDYPQSNANMGNSGNMGGMGSSNNPAYNRNYIYDLSSDILSGEFSISNAFDARNIQRNSLPRNQYPMNGYHPMAAMGNIPMGYQNPYLQWSNHPMFRVPPWYPMYPSLYALDLCSPPHIPYRMSQTRPMEEPYFGQPRPFGGPSSLPYNQSGGPSSLPYNQFGGMNALNANVVNPSNASNVANWNGDGFSRSFDESRLSNVGNSVVRRPKHGHSLSATNIPDSSSFAPPQQQPMDIWQQNVQSEQENPVAGVTELKDDNEIEDDTFEYDEDAYFNNLLKDLGDPIKNMQIPSLGNPVFGDLNF